MDINNKNDAFEAIKAASRIKVYVLATPNQAPTTFTASKREAYEVAAWMSEDSFANWSLHNGGTLTIGSRS